MVRPRRGSSEGAAKEQHRDPRRGQQSQEVALAEARTAKEQRRSRAGGSEEVAHRGSDAARRSCSRSRGSAKEAAKEFSGGTTAHRYTRLPCSLSTTKRNALQPYSAVVQQQRTSHQCLATR